MEDPSLHKGISPRVQRSEHKSDPRVLTRDDLDDAPNQRQYTHIDTDLDVAYSILFEEANNEYIKERENEEQTKANGKSLIPQRVYQSFLDSVEQDVSDYSNTLNLSTRLKREEVATKREIEECRNDVLHLKRNRAQLEVERLKVSQELKKVQRESKVLSRRAELIQRSKRLLSQGGILYSIPTIPPRYQTNSHKLLAVLNSELERKIESLKRRLGQ